MTREDFARAVLGKLGIPLTGENIRAMEAWMQAEGTSAANNPLATTQPWNGATNFNSVGVKNYQTADDGVSATVATLKNGYYPNILSALRSGTAVDVGQAIAASPWGTGGLVLKVLGADVSGNAPIGSSGASGASSGPSAASSSQPALANADEIRQVFSAFSGRDPTAEEIGRLTGQSLEQVTKAVGDTTESHAYSFATQALSLEDIMRSGARRPF